MLSKGALRVY